MSGPSVEVNQGAHGLEAERIRVTAGGTLIVDGVDCTVPAGSLAALIGPNGAGKSTLLRALAALEKPEAGTVRFADEDLHALPRKARARLATLVEQDATTELSLSVEAVVELGRLPHQSLWQGTDPETREIVAESLAAVWMSEFATRDVTSLSGGERQRVLLAKALAQRTSLLLLDEPTNHLDISSQLSVLSLLDGLARGGSTVLAALHDLSLAAAHCDSVIVLHSGRVVAAGPTMQTLTPALIREVYGVRASILQNPVTGRPVIAFSPLESSPTTSH